MGATDYPSWEEFTTTSFAASNQWPLLAPETPSFMSRPIARDAQGPRRGGRGDHRGPLCCRLRRLLRRGADGRLDCGAEAGAPAVRALPVGLHSGLRPRRVRASADGGLRRRGYPRIGDARPERGERARGPGRGRGQGPRCAPSGRGPGRDRAEQPLRELRDRQALRGARRRPARLRQPRHPLGRCRARLPHRRSPHRGLCLVEAQDVRVPRQHAPASIWSRSASAACSRTRTPCGATCATAPASSAPGSCAPASASRDWWRSSTAHGMARRASTSTSTWTASAAPARRPATSSASSPSRWA